MAEEAHAPGGFPIHDQLSLTGSIVVAARARHNAPFGLNRNGGFSYRHSLDRGGFTGYLA
ncbi:hypothetical protein [Amycolatopsis dongchuanensis]|uniref:hypothetical protein n=1 Tax=Amycolatopsis dongchuanensis TaxID=1070866 RepID=UPI0031FA1270